MNTNVTFILVWKNPAWPQGRCGEPGCASLGQAGTLSREGQHSTYLEPHQGQKSLHHQTQSRCVHQGGVSTHKAWLVHTCLLINFFSMWCLLSRAYGALFWYSCIDLILIFNFLFPFQVVMLFIGVRRAHSTLWWREVVLIFMGWTRGT